MSHYKSISCYSCQKRDENGNGTYTARIDYDGSESDLKEKTKAMRERQRLLNTEWRMEHRPKGATSQRGKKKSGEGDMPRTVMSDIKSSAAYLNTELLMRTHGGIPDIDLDGQDENFRSGYGLSFVIIGSSKAGKTYLMRELYHKFYSKKQKVFNNIKFINLLFSVNTHADVYSDFTDCYKVNKFDKNSQALINQLKKVNMVSKNKYNFNIMLDDIIHGKYSVLQDLILTYRNSSFSSIISIQYPYLISKASRSSINQCFFGKLNTDESIESVVKSFLGSIFTKNGYTTLPAQIQLYKKLTDDYHFLYYYSRKDILVRFRLSI